MKHFFKSALCAFVLCGGMLLSSCSNNNDQPVTPAPTPSIYARLGGTTMVQDPDAAAGVMIEKGRLSFRKVITTAIGLIATDVNTNASGNLGAHFAPLLAEVTANPAVTTGYAELVDNLTDFFSHNTGGTNPVNDYSGMDMVTAHNPATNSRMGVKATSADYTKFEGYVGAAAVANGVAANTQLYTDIVAVLESLRSPIVQAP